MHAEYVYLLVPTDIQLTSANIVSRVKTAIASAFSAPTFAAVVA